MIGVNYGFGLLITQFLHCDLLTHQYPFYLDDTNLQFFDLNTIYSSPTRALPVLRCSPCPRSGLFVERPSGVRLDRVMMKTCHAHLLLRGLCPVYLSDLLLALG